MSSSPGLDPGQPPAASRNCRTSLTRLFSWPRPHLSPLAARSVRAPPGPFPWPGVLFWVAALRANSLFRMPPCRRRRAPQRRAPRPTVRFSDAGRATWRETTLASGINIRTFFQGRWHEGNIPVMRAADHGAWLGSTVFDGARSFDGMAPDLDRHCARVNRSAEAMLLTPTRPRRRGPIRTRPVPCLKSSDSRRSSRRAVRA